MGRTAARDVNVLLDYTHTVIRTAHAPDDAAIPKNLFCHYPKLAAVRDPSPASSVRHENQGKAHFRKSGGVSHVSRSRIDRVQTPDPSSNSNRPSSAFATASKTTEKHNLQIDQCPDLLRTGFNPRSNPPRTGTASSFRPSASKTSRCKFEPSKMSSDVGELSRLINGDFRDSFRTCHFADLSVC